MNTEEFELHARVEDNHWWFKARRDILLDQLIKYVPAHRGRSVAEIGCGTGGNLKFLSGHYRVLGVDTSAEAIGHARRRTGCELFQGDFRDALAGKWNDIDAVILADVLEHVDDDTVFVEELVTCLKRDAYLLVTVPAHRFLWSEHDVILGHKRRYSAKELRALWSGLDVNERFFSAFNSALFPLIAIYRVLLRRHSASGKSDLRLPAPWINGLLYRIFLLERSAMRVAPLPFGASYLAVVRKR